MAKSGGGGSRGGRSRFKVDYNRFPGLRGLSRQEQQHALRGMRSAPRSSRDPGDRGASFRRAEQRETFRRRISGGGTAVRRIPE